jgi:TRAP-type transport system small permease protein
MHSLGTIEKFYYGVIEVIAVALFCAMLSCMVVQVFFRYVLATPLVWIEELSQFLLIWSIFWGAILAHRRALHPAVDFLVWKLPPRARAAATVVAGAITLTVLVLVVAYGFMMVESLRAVRSVAMNLPWMYVNTVVPLAALLMLPHQLRLILRRPIQYPDDLEPKSPPLSERN